MQNEEEQLSALVDDELDAPPGGLLTRLVEDQDSRERWARYHLIGDVLRDRETRLAPELRERVAAALADEPALLAPPVSLPARPSRPLARIGRWGLAAGFAAVALLGASFVAREPIQPDLSAADQARSAADSVAQFTQVEPQPQAVTWDDTGSASAANAQSVEFHRRLNSYLVNFNEQRADLGVPGVHPYVRIVGFETEPAP
jgi:sigma-E factor negative regulatory protein RseA